MKCSREDKTSPRSLILAQKCEYLMMNTMQNAMSWASHININVKSVVAGGLGGGEFYTVKYFTIGLGNLK